jgi:acyl-coenzyme A thioesterase PaaI-like protein
MIPEGFEVFSEDNSFHDSIAPIYFRIIDSGPEIGALVEQKHCNPVDFMHGGVMMSILDIAFSTAVSVSLGKFTSTPTISLNFDFITGAKVSDWVVAKVDTVTLKRTVDFVSGSIEGPRGSVARASGCFKIPTDIDAALGMSVEDYLVWRRGK